MYGPVTIFAHQLTNSTEKAEVAILVLGVNNITGHAVSRVPATGRHQQSRMAGLGKLLSRNLLHLESITDIRESDGQPSERHANEFHMKRIITHFLGDVSFETSNLQKIADTLDQGQGQEQSDDDSVGSNDVTPTNDYSIDPLSTSTMRMSLSRVCFPLVDMTPKIIRGSCPIGTSPECSDDDYKVLGKGQGKARYAQSAPS
jgi:hypothetical protein